MYQAEVDFVARGAEGEKLATRQKLLPLAANAIFQFHKSQKLFLDLYKQLRVRWQVVTCAKFVCVSEMKTNY